MALITVFVAVLLVVSLTMGYLIINELRSSRRVFESFAEMLRRFHPHSGPSATAAVVTAGSTPPSGPRASKDERSAVLPTPPSGPPRLVPLGFVAATDRANDVAEPSERDRSTTKRTSVREIARDERRSVEIPVVEIPKPADVPKFASDRPTLRDDLLRPPTIEPVPINTRARERIEVGFWAKLVLAAKEGHAAKHCNGSQCSGELELLCSCPCDPCSRRRKLHEEAVREVLPSEDAEQHATRTRLEAMRPLYAQIEARFHELLEEHDGEGNPDDLLAQACRDILGEGTVLDLARTGGPAFYMAPPTSQPEPQHCFKEPDCSISEADQPAPEGLDPKGWASIGSVVFCTCQCPACNPEPEPERRG